MKKRIIPVIAIIFLTIGLYPKTEIYKDRGTKITKAMLYTYVDFNQLEDGCQESKLFFFPNNKGDYEDFYIEICGKSPQYDENNDENNKNISNEEYIAYGGEPFWDIVIKDRVLSFSSPEQYNEETDTIEPINYVVKTEKEEKYIHFLGKDISATFEKKDCISDGKGDVLPYTVTLLKDGDLEYNGCGNTK